MVLDFLKGLFEFLMEILETIVFVGTLFIVVYLFILQPNQVKGASMEPTFITEEYIFTSKVTYKFRPYERGDVVVFKSPKNPDIEYIKRVIGVPGDIVVVQDGEVFVNGIQLEEGYISSEKTPLWDTGYMKDGVPVSVPETTLLVMGDNRPRSSDSREFGPITMESVVGQVFYRYFPTDKMGVIENPLPEGLRASKVRYNKQMVEFVQVYSVD